MDNITPENLIYSLIKDRVKVSESEYIKSISGYELIPLVSRGELNGVVMVNGNEVHVAVKKGSHAISKGRIKAVIGKLLDRYGCVVTSVMNSNKKGKDFVEKFGFTEKSADEFLTYYEMRYCRYV